MLKKYIFKQLVKPHCLKLNKATQNTNNLLNYVPNCTFGDFFFYSKSGNKHQPSTISQKEEQRHILVNNLLSMINYWCSQNKNLLQLHQGGKALIWGFCALLCGTMRRAPYHDSNEWWCPWACVCEFFFNVCVIHMDWHLSPTAGRPSAYVGVNGRGCHWRMIN